MSEFVRVPVPDALAGTLPPVCCMTGEKASGYAPMVVPKRVGLAWLLLLAGPLGVVVLAAIWQRVRVRYLVRLPMSAAAFNRMHTLQVQRLWCSWLSVIGLVASVAMRSLPGVGVLALGLSVLGFGTAIRAHVRLPWSRPTMIADVTGRWLELRGVHPKFVDAVGARRLSS